MAKLEFARLDGKECEQHAIASLWVVGQRRLVVVEEMVGALSKDPSLQRLALLNVNRARARADSTPWRRHPTSLAPKGTSGAGCVRIKARQLSLSHTHTHDEMCLVVHVTISIRGFLLDILQWGASSESSWKRLCAQALTRSAPLRFIFGCHGSGQVSFPAPLLHKLITCILCSKSYLQTARGIQARGKWSRVIRSHNPHHSRRRPVSFASHVGVHPGEVCSARRG